MNSELDQTKAEHADVLRRFQASFFAMSRLASFDWTFLDKDLEKKSTELLSDIMKQTCLHPVCRTFPPAVRYRRLFLSELIRREAATCEPVDELYDALAEVLRAEEQPECYKTYLLPCGGAVSLLESVALISEGTTGLVTWEAALYLAEWALDNQQAFSGRAVLELGSGVGMTGITICRSCSPSKYVFSDCHPAVLHTLRRNVQLNRLAASLSVCVEDLDWTTAKDERLRQIGANTVIAADVVYDPDIVSILVKLLSLFLRGSPPEVAPEALICSTIRNPDTYNGFKQQLGAAGLRHHVMTGPAPHTFPYNRASTIELIKVHI
ncbi:protein-lysine N-methyltransferase EEF2KMT isoform X2 [Thalassophryne amazonica]|uniref:protein-lysine N-methyltransferase EEF2KMT isoform X2 n=1 Tax=Thalassophryne amazonica TaxID=390379 RepID=UPI0014724D6E|nr:protein-lysine N-methyltransferase EEF2KMT isoform X2 [Thalassophryne amazonica]